MWNAIVKIQLVNSKLQNILQSICPIFFNKYMAKKKKKDRVVSTKCTVWIFFGSWLEQSSYKHIFQMSGENYKLNIKDLLFILMLNIVIVWTVFLKIFLW